MSRFATAPRRIILSLEAYTSTFLLETNFVASGQEHSEVTRQCFDIISLSFKDYTEALKQLPKIELLINNDKYFDAYGNLSACALNLKQATMKYGIGIFLSCYENGIIINQETAYILESVKDDLCLLYNTENME